MKNLFFLLLALPLLVRAQEVITLNEVILTDTKLELPRAKKTKRVIRLSTEDLSPYSGQPLALILNNLTGIEISGSRGAEGQNLGLYARGGNNRQILITLDGMPINDPSQPASDFDLRLLDLSSIESIEVIKGPSSVVYGSGAATAVIAITTKKTSDRGLTISLTGSAGTQRGSSDSPGLDRIQNTIALRSQSLFFEMGQHYSGGMSALSGTTEPDAFDRKHAGLGGSFTLAKTKVSATARLNEFSAGFDNTYPLEDADFISLSKQLTVTLASETSFGDRKKLITNAQYGLSDREIRSNYPVSYGARSFSADAYFTQHTGRLSYLVGAYLLDQHTDFESIAQMQSVEPYLNVNYAVSDPLSISAGARFISHSSFGSDLVYTAGPAYTTALGSLKAKFFADFSSAFIAPSLAQLFGPFGPNPDLQPETNTTTSIGLELLGNKNTEYSVQLFSRNETNRVLYSLVDAATYAYQYQNTGNEFGAKGVEVFVSQPLRDNLQSSLSYTFTQLDTEDVLRLPKHKLNLLLSYDLAKGSSLRANYHWVSSRLDTDFSTFETRSLDPYGLFDLTFSKKLSGKASFGVQLYNVLNTDFTEIIGFATRGRNLSLSYRIEL